MRYDVTEGSDCREAVMTYEADTRLLDPTTAHKWQGCMD